VLRTKSIHSRIVPDLDGLRLLVTRFRGRGLPAARYDAWLPNLAPSEQLLRRFQRGEVSWRRFAAGYRAELLMDGPLDRRNATIRNHGQKFTLRLLRTLAGKGPVTLLCHCPEDEPRCHRHVLGALINASAPGRRGAAIA
jgi:uncharacterized protein YeaO (DUF488 family)